MSEHHPPFPFSPSDSVKRLICMTLILISVLAGGTAGAESDRLFKDDPQIPWHIAADRITYDQETQVYEAEGSVAITKAGRRLTADHVRFDQKNGLAFAEGSVVLTAGEDYLMGDALEIDLTDETGTVYNGVLFLSTNHFYIRGDRIRKTGPETYGIDSAQVTACDGEKPDWRLTGEKLKITVEGYGVVRNAALWARKVPVAYTPYMIFPVKEKRQTGLLVPEISYGSRKGVAYSQPFFWAIDDHSDATFFAQIMAARGIRGGGEYRYILDDLSHGIIMADGLRDRKVDDGSPGSEEWGYPDDGVLRPNTDRYWFRMKHDQALPLDFTGRLDLDVVSDQDYLHEFQQGYGGFVESQDAFLETFGRGIDNYDEPIRRNRLNLNRIWSHYSLTGEFQWDDAVINRRQSDEDPTLQRLPVVGFTGIRQPLAESRFYYDFTSEYTNFYRKDGQSGSRFDVHPRIYYPFRLKDAVSVDTSAGFRQTVWAAGAVENREEDSTAYRGIYDLALDTSTDLFRIYDFPFLKFDRLKHTIRPQVRYTFIPDQGQDALPSFDPFDRIRRQNKVTYSLINTFTARQKTVVGGEDGESAETRYAYHPFSRFKLEQTYFIQDPDPADPDISLFQEPDRSFSPLFGEISLSPARVVTLYADAEMSTYTGDFFSRNIGVGFSDRRGDWLYVSHRYSRDISESIYVESRLKVSDQVLALADYERSILTSRDIRKGVGLAYFRQCWSVDVRYNEEENDRSLSFFINLLGIGGFHSDY